MNPGPTKLESDIRLKYYNVSPAMEPTSDGDYSTYEQALIDLEQSERDARLAESGPLSRWRKVTGLEGEEAVREKNRQALQDFVTELE